MGNEDVAGDNGIALGFSMDRTLVNECGFRRCLGIGILCQKIKGKIFCQTGFFDLDIAVVFAGGNTDGNGLGLGIGHVQGLVNGLLNGIFRFRNGRLDQCFAVSDGIGVPNFGDQTFLGNRDGLHGIRNVRLGGIRILVIGDGQVRSRYIIEGLRKGY